MAPARKLHFFQAIPFQPFSGQPTVKPLPQLPSVFVLAKLFSEKIPLFLRLLSGR